MLVSAIVNPACLQAKEFDQPGHDIQSRLFFKGISENGLLLVDSENRLTRFLEDTLLTLPTKYGQDLLIRWTELVKKKRKRVISADSRACQSLRSVPVDRLPQELARHCPVDGILTSEVTTPADVLLNTYDQSVFEDKRRQFLVGSSPLDALSRNEVDALIVPAIRYAKWLRFYDKQIGRGNNIVGFRRGIEYILKLWLKHGHFASRGTGEVTVLTGEARNIYPDDTAEAVQYKMKENREAYRVLCRNFVDPLSTLFPWPISVIVKVDSRGNIHPRHLEAQVAILLFEGGFDFIRNDGSTFKRTSLQIDNNAYEHLREYRELPNAAYLEEHATL